MTATLLDSESFGSVCASALLAKKAEGHQFNRSTLADFIDVQLEAWQQSHAKAPTSPEVPTAESIYAAYPRKVGKVAALKAIKAAILNYKSTRSQSAPHAILEATQAYAAAVAQWPAKDREYIPHPSTWFNRGSYLDDPKEWLRGEPARTVTTRDYTRI